MIIPTRSAADILAAISERRSLAASIPSSEVLPLLADATGRQYRPSAATQKRALRGRARNGVRIVVTWLWDIAYIFVIPGHDHGARR